MNTHTLSSLSTLFSLSKFNLFSFSPPPSSTHNHRPTHHPTTTSLFKENSDNQEGRTHTPQFKIKS
ncbi:hypothetical protein Hanom_Chr15g01381161 [Helianthus anomalus]